jgi:hypothetical protein
VRTRRLSECEYAVSTKNGETSDGRFEAATVASGSSIDRASGPPSECCAFTRNGENIPSSHDAVCVKCGSSSPRTRLSRPDVMFVRMISWRLPYFSSP